MTATNSSQPQQSLPQPQHYAAPPQQPVYQYQQQAAAVGQPAPYPWAVGPEVWVTEQTEPLAYHRLLRGMRRYEGWKPLLMSLIGAVSYIVATVIVFIIIGLVLVLVMGPELLQNPLFEQLTANPEGATALLENSTHPLFLAAMLLSVILMLPAAWFAMRLFGKGVFSRVWSVTLRIRWGLLLRFTGVAVGIYLLVQGTTALLGLGAAAMTYNPPTQNTAMLVLSFVVVLLLVPLQATAEEVVFRGLLLQTIGSWLRSPVLAVIVTSVLFGAAHVQYNIWGMLITGFMGLAMAIITIRTGGLEAAMALHTVNNVMVFSVNILGFTSDPENLGPAELLYELVILVLFTAAVELIWRRGAAQGRPWQRHRVDTVQVRRPLASLTQPAVPAVPAAPAAPAVPAAAGAAVAPAVAPAAGAADGTGPGVAGGAIHTPQQR